MKDGWKMKKLGEVCLFENGDRGENYPSKSVQTTSGVPFINAGHLTDFGIDYQTLNFIPRERFDLLGNGKIRKNDILFCLRGSLGKFACVGELSEGAIASSLVIVRPCKSVLKSYVLAYFQSDLCAEMISKFKNGAAQPNLSAGNLKEFKIPLPALPEQQRIVAILDEAFEGIATAKANADKNLKNARQLFESHLNSVFSQRGEGWVEKTLGDTAKVKGGKRVPKGYQLSTNQTDFPYIRVTDFTDNGSIDMGDLRYISADVHNKIKNYVIYSEDLYISIAGTIGKTGIIPDELNGSNLTENACRLAFKPGLSNRFVYYFTLTSSFIEQAGVNTRTAAQPKLALSRLSTIKLGVPSVQAQQRLVDDFDALCEETQRLESIYQKKIDALDALKKSILQKAFSGKM